MSNFVKWLVGMVFTFLFAGLSGYNVSQGDYGIAVFDAFLALYWTGYTLIALYFTETEGF